MLVLGKCEGVRVSNLKEIGEVVSSDGIDVCGSRDVLIEGCFLHNNDDCVVIKACANYDNQTDWRADVENVEVRKCVFMNAGAGNTMEIGFELRTEQIRNIRFHDIDVLWKHGIGAIFSINNTDRATVSGVVFENIRVEHYYDKLVSIRISESRYSKDTERGRVRDILFKNIDVAKSPFNDGYSHSLIGGFDEEHNVERVVFENFTHGGIKATRARHIDLFTRHANGIEFR